MRILGLDHGTKRIGVALSDELKFIAQPLEHIPAEPADDALKAIISLVKTRDVELILVGMPRNMDGTYGEAAQKVKAFIEQLSALCPVPIRSWDERLTSAQANRALISANVRRDQRKQKVDGVAAAVLLQSYLDTLQN
ncbi:MAG: Holliday junction resolvase RuvX [Verrucomicrobia bacterium]|nr:Holliday junction resolvase RuvX [Verrucomicrobiota bacterium]